MLRDQRKRTIKLPLPASVARLLVVAGAIGCPSFLSAFEAKSHIFNAENNPQIAHAVAGHIQAISRILPSDIPSSININGALATDIEQVPALVEYFKAQLNSPDLNGVAALALLHGNGDAEKIVPFVNHHGGDYVSPKEVSLLGRFRALSEHVGQHLGVVNGYHSLGYFFDEKDTSRAIRVNLAQLGGVSLEEARSHLDKLFEDSQAHHLVDSELELFGVPYFATGTNAGKVRLQPLWNKMSSSRASLGGKGLRLENISSSMELTVPEIIELENFDYSSVMRWVEASTLLDRLGIAYKNLREDTQGKFILQVHGYDIPELNTPDQWLFKQMIEKPWEGLGNHLNGENNDEAILTLEQIEKISAITYLLNHQVSFDGQPPQLERFLDTDYRVLSRWVKFHTLWSKMNMHHFQVLPESKEGYFRVRFKGDDMPQWEDLTPQERQFHDFIWGHLRDFKDEKHREMYVEYDSIGFLPLRQLERLYTKITRDAPRFDDFEFWRAEQEALRRVRKKLNAADGRNQITVHQ